MSDWIRARAGRASGTAGLTPAQARQAEELAELLGLTLSEARQKVLDQVRGQEPAPEGNAGAGTSGEPPRGKFDVSAWIRRKAGR